MHTSTLDNYPHVLIEQYMRATTKVKKIERFVFKRFAPNVTDVLSELQQLARKLDEAGIYQYCAICYLDIGKCEMSLCNNLGVVQSYLKSARAFVRANNNSDSLCMRSNKGEYTDGAIRSFNLALERIADDSVLKAAVIREMSQLLPYYDGTSSFSSPCHRIFEMETSAIHSLEQRDFLAALEKLTDIVDNIYERKRQDLYVDLLSRVEVLRLLLLIHLNLPPARQSPSHIKLIEYYNNFRSTETEVGNDDATVQPAPSSSFGEFIPLALKYALSDIVTSWCEHNEQNLRCLLKQLVFEFTSLTESHRLVIACICENIEKGY